MNRPFLSGDAARRYAEVLIRSAGRDSLDAARDIVTANLGGGGAGRSKSEQASNDIISMMTLDAALDRIAGDLDSAERKINALAEHNFVRTGEAPYAARQELRLEAFRLRIARGDTGPGLQDDLRAFAAERMNRHHVMFALQTQLLLTETNPANREALLASLELRFRILRWGLFESDVELLRAGGSVIHDPGL